MDKKIEKAVKLVRVCRDSLMKNEYNTRTVAGVKGLSHSDVETAILYAETIISFGTYQGQLMPPRGGVADLLAKFGLKD